MLKFEFRKLAMVIVAFMAVGMMAACSGSSSTDDALTPPGDNYLGTVRFDVDPAANTVTATPVASPWSDTAILGDGSGGGLPITVSTSNITSGGMNFDVTVNWTDTATDGSNIHLAVNSSTDTTVTLSNSDTCTGDWATCLGGGNEPSIIYTSDDIAEGAYQFTVCDPTNLSDCNVIAVDAMVTGPCGGITESWTLGGGSGSGFSFWATLYGDRNGVVPITDSRYDYNTSTVYIEVNGYGGQNVEGGATSTLLANQWFYVHSYLDNPGNNRPGQGVTIQGMEDVDNINAWLNGGSTADYFYTGWAQVGVRFDPAVIELNSYPLAIAPLDPPGNGGFTFNTGSGTKLKMLIDPNTTADGVDFSGAAESPNILASNMMGIYRQHNTNKLVTASYLYGNPCGQRNLWGKNCNPTHGVEDLASIDWNLWFAPLHAKATAAGKSTFIRKSNDTNTTIGAADTEGVPSAASHTAIEIPRSANYPIAVYDVIPRAATAPIGQYNGSRKYVCVQ